jgi:Uma2 family endonuclease
MGMPAAEKRRWTVAEVRALPEEPGKRYEVVDGELLVSPGPVFRHQFMEFELMKILDRYLSAERRAWVLGSRADVEPDEYTMVQPDVFVVPAIGSRRPVDWAEAGRLLLVIEILSPGTARHDRVVKRALYRRMGAEYWIVDLDARVVERWVPGAPRPDVISDRIEWRLEGAPDVLAIDLPALFADLAGDPAP